MPKLQRRHIDAIFFAVGALEGVNDTLKTTIGHDRKQDLEEALQILKAQAISFELSNPDEEDLGNIHDDPRDAA